MKLLSETMKSYTGVGLRPFFWGGGIGGGGWQRNMWIFLAPLPRTKLKNKTKLQNIHPELPTEDFEEETFNKEGHKPSRLVGRAGL